MSTAKCFFAFEVENAAGARCPRHDHPCTEIVIVQDGRGSIIQGGSRERYATGDFFVYQPGPDHWAENETDGLHLCVGVSGLMSESLEPGVRHATPLILELVPRFRREIESQDDLRYEALNQVCGLLVIEIRRLQRRDEPELDHAAQAKAIIDSSFSQPISVSDVASDLFLSPDYLRQLFRKTYGASPTHYVVKRRIEFACELLQKTNLAINEVALRCGIDNPYYFSRLFKKMTGQTPTAYRKANPWEG